jgi:signal peptidase II
VTGLLVAAGIVGADAALKVWLRRTLGESRVALGRFGALKMVEARVWLSRVGPASARLLWGGWSVAAAGLVVAAAVEPAFQVAACLLLGGSLANLLEQTRRGAVSDYVCLHWWPAFNLADAALAAGAAGAALTLMRAAARLV